MAAINKFNRNKVVRGRDLDTLINKVNALSHIRGSGGISVMTGPLGTSLIGNASLGLSATNVRRAITTQAAPAAKYITANLYGSDGIEITTGVESGLHVYCSIIGGVNLNGAVPRLTNDTDMFVTKTPYSSASSIAQRWYCVNIFQKSQDCD